MVVNMAPYNSKSRHFKIICLEKSRACYKVDGVALGFRVILDGKVKTIRPPARSFKLLSKARVSAIDKQDPVLHDFRDCNEAYLWGDRMRENSPSSDLRDLR